MCGGIYGEAFDAVFGLRGPLTIFVICGRSQRRGVLLVAMHSEGGREGRDLGAVELAIAVEALGAGEIMLNCIDQDGTNQVCHC